MSTSQDVDLDRSNPRRNAFAPPAEVAEAFLRAREMRQSETRREVDQPLLWTLLGLLLVACFFLALATPWFPR
jgi:hypothetical protein